MRTQKFLKGEVSIFQNATNTQLQLILFAINENARCYDQTWLHSIVGFRGDIVYSETL